MIKVAVFDLIGNLAFEPIERVGDNILHRADLIELVFPVLLLDLVVVQLI